MSSRTGNDGGRMNKFTAADGLGLNNFEAAMNLPGGKLMRSVPGRSTMRLQIAGRAVYLKRYEPEYYSFLDRLFHHDEAEHEWNMLHELQRAGFNVPTPLAF